MSVGLVGPWTLLQTVWKLELRRNAAIVILNFIRKVNLSLFTVSWSLVIMLPNNSVKFVLEISQTLVFVTHTREKVRQTPARKAVFLLVPSRKAAPFWYRWKQKSSFLMAVVLHFCISKQERTTQVKKAKCRGWLSPWASVGEQCATFRTRPGGLHSWQLLVDCDVFFLFWC